MLHADAHGDPARPRVVLVHGFTQTRRSWGPLVAALAEHHEVVAVDAPGHGRSSDIRADLVGGARLLGETCGSAAYVGYSMGGRLALHLALERPDLVRRLVLVGATAGLDTDDERAARRAADEALAQELERDGLGPFLGRWLDSPLFATLTEEAANLEDRLDNTVAGLASSLRLAGTGSQEPLWEHLAALTMPVLLVAGERDEKFTALAHRLAGGWGGPSRVSVVAGAGHACHLERPRAFLDVVVPFLAEGHRTESPAANASP